MGAFDGFRISVSGMDAQLQRLRVVASNMANANATRSADGQVYRRKEVILASTPLENPNASWEDALARVEKVETVEIVEDTGPLKQVYMPNHPDADKKGFVQFPNVESFEEMVNMMDALRSYEANVTAFNASKDMIKKAFEIGR